MPPSRRPAGQLNGYSRQCTPSAVAHRYVLAPAALVPNQAAFPDTARLLPVIRALADHGVHGPRGGRMKPVAMTSFSSVLAAWGTHGGLVGAMLVGLVT